MIVRKNLNLRGIIAFSGHHFVWLSLWMLISTSLYFFTDWIWITMPWFPLSVIGTAVAFYVGFKNNQAYGRLWEARKVWGGIVNSSRMFASIVHNNIGKNHPSAAQKIIYQNIAWLYALRTQLLQPTQWEHVSGWGTFGRFNRRRRERIGVGAFIDQENESDLSKYLQFIDSELYSKFPNKAIYILNDQTKSLQELYDQGSLEWFKQVELQKILNEFYNHQGKLERLKRFPLPRQYGSFSFIFVCIFIFLLPFGLLGEFEKFNPQLIWLTIPIGSVVGWIYVVMEMIGDYSENPFEGLPYDIPMLSICRTIEIDLLSMLGESTIPKPIQAQTDILL